MEKYQEAYEALLAEVDTLVDRNALAEEEAHHRHGRVAVHAAQTHGQRPPGEHEEGDPAAGSEPLQEDVGGYLERILSDKLPSTLLP